MPVYHDQMGRAIHLGDVPNRIISVVPSQTELLFYLGLDKEITGITKFCIHPAEKFKRTTKIGGTKNLDLAKIRKLNPDLIIANKEENDRSQLKELIIDFPVWISDIDDLDSALDMIKGVGAITGKSTAADALALEIAERFKQLTPAERYLTTAYFIWRKPYMVAAAGTFINSMLAYCGLVNVFNRQRYPELTNEMLVTANPEVILLSSEPYPFKEKHITELKALLPDALCLLVDGELFSWYGSRMLLAPAYFKKLREEIAERLHNGSVDVHDS